MVDNLHAEAPILVAHRGYSGRFPENTLQAYKAAYEHGARYMELDLQMTRDEVVVLHHDTSLARMANVEQDVRDLTLAEFLSHAAAYEQKFGQQHAQNEFTSFHEYCRWASQCGDVRTFVEVKQESIDRFGIPLLFERIQHDIDAFELSSMSIIISFNFDVLVHARQHSNLKIGWVLPDWSDHNHDLANELQADFLFSDTASLPTKNDDIWRGSWQWAIYNLDDVDSAKKMASRGFGFLETNEIGSLLKSNLFRTH